MKVNVTEFIHLRDRAKKIHEFLQELLTKQLAPGVDGAALKRMAFDSGQVYEELKQLINEMEVNIK